MPRPAVEPVLRFAPELLLAAQGVRVAIFDVDGVLTDGRIYIGEQGEAFKAFSTLDGHGLKLLAQGGIVPVVITGRDSPAVRRRVADLGIAQAVYGASDKLAAATPMLGYLVVGVLIGPNATALAKDSAGVQYLAEFGVVFLMFVIGLEFNLPKLKSMRKLVFGLGLAQVMLTIVGSVLGHYFLVWIYSFTARPWELSWQGAIVLGGAMAMSSTAIVVKLMAERLELESEHGKRVMGVLLFQDLAVVPLLVLIPALGDSGEDMVRTLGLALVKAALLLTLLLVGGQRVMRWWLTLVARRKSEELFVLNLLFVTLGLAWLTEHAGLSLALGAFVAGMLIAETEYKHQVETDIRPFHDVLLGLFFITIGMKLDWRPVLAQWPLVLMLTTVPVLAKALLVAALARMFRTSPGVALRTGLYLAQAGEFGFVLLALGAEQGLVAQQWMSPVLASMVLSMLATPFVVMFSGPIVMRLSANEWMLQSLELTTIARKSIKTEAHVIICGYGRSGQNLARMLEHESIPYMALDLDPDRVRCRRVRRPRRWW